MDEVQAAFYRLMFRNAFLEKKGAEFQDWFARLVARAFGPDFEAVRPYGNRGDLKCDGRRISTGTIFQCYAPDKMKAARLNAKIEGDFVGAYENWGGAMVEWVLVHNHGGGLPASSGQLLDRLRQSHPEVTIEVWTEPALQKLADRLPLEDQQALFGFAPSKSGLETLAMADLQPVIHQLQFMDPEPGQEPLTPPSRNKLEKNRLSADAAALLRLGRRKEALVETWFTKNRRPDLGERIAEAFRRRYAQLNDGTRSADQVFGHLQQYAGVGGEPARQAAVLAVLSYFFERCDIFEDPEEGNDTADEAHSA